MSLFAAPLAGLSAQDAVIGLVLLAGGLGTGYALRGWRPRKRDAAFRERLLPLGLCALTVAILVVLAADATQDEAGRSQLLAGLGILAGILLLWGVGPTRWVAKREIEITKEGEEQVIEPGEWVTPTVAKRQEAKDRFSETYVAKEDFLLDGETVAKGDEVAEGDARRDDVAPHVRIVRKADQRIAFKDVTKTKIAKGAEVPEDLRTAQNARRRVVFAPGRLFIGADGRWSTSKLTALLWTLTLGWALLSLLIFTQAMGEALALGEKKTGFSDLDLPDQYYLLLGGPFAAALLAKAWTTTKVENGTLIKMEKPAETNPIVGLQQVLANDENTTDLVDSQYFLFNLLALGYFFVVFIGGLKEGLPDIPEVLFGLTSAAALAYTAKKGLERDVPVILSATPSTVRSGEVITVRGRNLAPGGAVPAAEIGGRPTPPVEVVASQNPERDELRVTVPLLPSGTANLVVTPVAGRPTEPYALTVQAGTVSAVAPEPIPVRPGQRIAITGTGFGEVQGTVTLGGQPLVVTSWSPSSVVAQVAEKTRYSISGGSAVLEVRAGTDVIARNTSAEALLISAVEPKSFEKKGGQQLVLTGRGFMSYDFDATLGGSPLDVVSRADTQLVLKLRAGMRYPLGAVRLLLAANGEQGYEAATDVTLTEPKS